MSTYNRRVPAHDTLELQRAPDMVAKRLRPEEVVHALRRREDILQEPDFGLGKRFCAARLGEHIEQIEGEVGFQSAPTWV